MSEAERMQIVLDELKLSPLGLVKSLGYDKANKVYNILKGRNGISEKFAQEITDKYININYHWLRTGQGNMIDIPITNNTQDGQGNLNIQTIGGSKNKIKEPSLKYGNSNTKELLIVIDNLEDRLNEKDLLLIEKDKTIDLLREMLELYKGKTGG